MNSYGKAIIDQINGFVPRNGDYVQISGKTYVVDTVMLIVSDVRGAEYQDIEVRMREV
jgi:hypothetical protein